MLGYIVLVSIIVPGLLAILNIDQVISPLWNNIISALFTVIYIKTTMDISLLVRKRLGFNADISRKFIHVMAGCWILFWPLFDVTHWSWRLNILVPSVMSVKLFYKVCFLWSLLLLVLLLLSPFFITILYSFVNRSFIHSFTNSFIQQ